MTHQAATPPDDASKKGPLDRVLSLFAETRPGEGASALLLAFSVFVLLMSYYVLKSAREPLILMGGKGGGAELKSYASGGQALLLIPVTFLYGKLAQHVGRIKLITIVSLVFAANLVGFVLLLQAGVNIGVPFFLWVGVFNVMIVAQFWSFAADVYTEEQGKRLFAILGIGSTVGAVAGSLVSRQLAPLVAPSTLLLLAAALLLGWMGLIHVVHRREVQAGEGAKSRRDGKDTKEGAKDETNAPLGKKGGFALLLSDRYLLLIAAFLFLLNCINTNGEYILDRTLLQHVKDATPAGVDAEAWGKVYITQFKASYFLYVNTATVLLQLFAVSRIIKYLGVRVALFIAPVVSLLGYSGMLLMPLLGFIMVVKIAENTLDYSLQNTAKQALWLLTSRDEKYKAKNVTDSFIVRAGDFLSAGITMLGATLHFTTMNFVMVNAVLVVCWLFVVMLLTRAHKTREAKGKDGDHNAPGPGRGAAAAAH